MIESVKKKFENRFLRGIAASPGIVIGRAYVFQDILLLAEKLWDLRFGAAHGPSPNRPWGGILSKRPTAESRSRRRRVGKSRNIQL